MQEETDKTDTTVIGVNLARKLSAVMSSIDRVPKNGYNSFSKFKYATADDILKAIRKPFAQQGLALLPSIVEATREQDKNGELYTKAKFEFRIIDGDSGEEHVLPWYGESPTKTGDKGINIASVAALKFFLKTLFLIDTGDESDADTEVTLSYATFKEIDRLGVELYKDNWSTKQAEVFSYASAGRTNVVDELTENEGLKAIEGLKKKKK